MRIIMFIGLMGFILGVVPAQASMSQFPLYKTALPNADKPKCIGCHVDSMPKKADGQHELNDYGIAVVKAAKAAGKDTPDSAAYAAVGSIEDFAKKAAASK